MALLRRKCMNGMEPKAWAVALRGWEARENAGCIFPRPRWTGLTAGAEQPPQCDRPRAPQRINRSCHVIAASRSLRCDLLHHRLEHGHARGDAVAHLIANHRLRAVCHVRSDLD